MRRQLTKSQVYRLKYLRRKVREILAINTRLRTVKWPSNFDSGVLTDKRMAYLKELQATFGYTIQTYIA